MKSRRISHTILPLLLSIFFLALAVQATHKSSGPQTRKSLSQVSFARDVAPLMFKYCSPCHRPGEAAPFPLLSYQDAAKYAGQIAVITRKGIMPPWLPEGGDFTFTNELHMTEEQIDVFRRWAEAGAPPGDPRDLPPAPKFTPGWQLGRPDLILHAQKPYALPARGADNYWNFIFPTDFRETRWVRAIEIRPGEKRVVHHANILLDRLHSSRAQEKQPGDGFAGMELRIESESFDPDSHIFFWKPGSVPHVEPADMALRLQPGDDFVLNTHLQPSGKAESIEPSIGVYFTEEPASRFPLLLELQNDRALDIPPGATNFQVTDEFTLPVEVELLAVYPHAHYLGKDLLATVKFPDASSKTLIHIPRWDLNWQAVFYYADSVVLPRGTIVSMRYVYDNSAANIANPFDPPQRITGGNRTTDEMAHLWLQVLPHGEATTAEESRRLLQETLARHDVARDPGDFAAQYNLGAMLQVRGESAEALSHFQAAVAARPSDAIANTALGGALLALGNSNEAIAPLQAALTDRPDYFAARYNLGLAFASLGQFDQAVIQFQEAVRLNSQDSMAQANLGAALAQNGILTVALEHLQKAVQLDPHNSLAQENLLEVERRLAAEQKH
jgi:tetratricopeptide (TPR) repeat protein